MAGKLSPDPVVRFGRRWGLPAPLSAAAIVIPGALFAVPILAGGKIVCDHVPRLQIVGKFLGA